MGRGQKPHTETQEYRRVVSCLHSFLRCMTMTAKVYILAIIFSNLLRHCDPEASSIKKSTLACIKVSLLDLLSSVTLTISYEMPLKHRRWSLTRGKWWNMSPRSLNIKESLSPHINNEALMSMTSSAGKHILTACVPNCSRGSTP